MRLLLAFLTALSALAAPPTISSITTRAEMNGITVQYNVTPDSYCQVRYGLATGVYLWSSASWPSSVTPGICSVPIPGLADGTTYYFLPTARPNPDNDTDICLAGGCGSSEVSNTTVAASVSHEPAPPAAVQSNLTTAPDTTGYAIINLVDGGAGVAHECVAAATVTAPAGYSWTVTAGDTLTSILATIGFGTVVQIPKGTSCHVKITDALYGVGYELARLPVDPLATGGLISAANHRWIIIRTTPTNPADLPPFNFRTTPTFAANYGNLMMVTPPGSFSGSGGIFQGYDSGANPCHHYWIENLKMSVDETQTGVTWPNFIKLGNGEGGGVAPFPEYIVIRGNYFHPPPRPVLASPTAYMYGGIAGTMAAQIAIVGNYTDNAYPGGGSGTYFFNMYFQDCGSGSCSTGGPILYDNNYVEGMAMSLYIEENNALRNTVPHDFTVTHNSFYWPHATLAYSQSLISYGNRNHIEFKGGEKVLIAGNFIKGQWAAADTGPPILLFGQGKIQDIEVRSSYIQDVASGFTVGSSNYGHSYYANGNRFKIHNNVLFNAGRGPRNAGGGGAGNQVLGMGIPIMNLQFAQNTIVGPFPILGSIDPFYPWVYYYSGGIVGDTAGFKFQGNIFPYGLFANVLNTSGVFVDYKGYDSSNGHPFTPSGQWSQLYSINYAGQLGSFSGGATSAAGGLSMGGVSVVSGGSSYPSSGSVTFAGCTGTPAATYHATGGVITEVFFSDFGSGCTPGSMTATASTGGTGSGASLKPWYGITPSYTWGGNVVTCTTQSDVDMDWSTCSGYVATMPTGDTYPQQNTTAARLVAAGLAGHASNDFNCTSTTTSGCGAGANMAQVEADLGIVSQIRVRVSGTSAAVSYLAPDLRACSVDISSDGGASWTRHGDGGGTLLRSVALTTTASTAYVYRVLCYYDQSQGLSAGWFSFPSDPSNLATAGSFTTLANSTVTASIPFNLAAVSGADTFAVVLTAPDGSTTYSNTTCTASPCTINSVPIGDYLMVSSYKAGSTVLATGVSQPIPIR